MPWSKYDACQALWRDLDLNTTNGQIQAFLREHLEKAFNAGCATGTDAVAALELIQGYAWQLDESPHGVEIRRRALAAIEKGRTP